MVVKRTELDCVCETCLLEEESEFLFVKCDHNGEMVYTSVIFGC